MKKIFTCLWIFIGLWSHLSAQNIDWEARMNTLRIRENYSFACSGSCPCWEAGAEDYTAKVRVKDNIMASFTGFVCMTCDVDGDWNCNVDNTFLGSGTNVNATTFTVSYDGWEDDGGDRCNHDSGDDCRCSNDNLASITIRSGSLCNWQIYGAYGCNTYHDNFRVKLRWRWSTAQFSTHPGNQTACDGTNATFSAALNSSYNGGVTYQWQYWNGTSWVSQGSASTTYSNLVITANTSINGRQYRLQVYQCDYDGGTRYTYSNPATLTVKTLSSVSGASIAGISSQCGTGFSLFNISGGTAGTGAVWRWYLGSCSGTSIATGTSLNYNLPIGTTTLLARLEGDCNTTACISKTITVNQPSSPMQSASYTPAAICAGNSVSVTAAGGTLGTNAGWRWYSNAGLTTQIATGNPVNINPQTYPTVYVAAVDASSICPVSSALTVNLSGVNIHTASTNPTATNYSSASAFVCDGENVSVTISGGALGNGALWVLYDDIPGNPLANVVATSSSPAFNFTPAETGSYWVRAENLCGNTSAAEVKVIVNGTAELSGPLTNTNSSSTCIVNDNQWHVFRNADNEIIGAINSNGQNLGNVTFNTTLGSAGPYGSGGFKCPGVAEYHIARVVNVSAQNQPLNPVNIRLFFTNNEYLSHQSTSNSQSNFYKYCYGVTNNPFDMTVSALNASGLPDSTDNMTRSLKPGSTDIYQYEFQLHNLPANGVHTGSRLDINGVDMYIHNSGGVYSVLPVELVSFYGSHKDMSVQLDWGTASEINNSHFVIERSENGADFLEIGKINGHGTISEPKNYQYTDFQVEPGKVYYYRLKQIDYDGVHEYSSIITMDIPAASGLQFGVLYPNPASHEVQFRIYSDKILYDLRYKLYSVDGSLVQEKSLPVNEGVNQYRSFIGDLPAGTYQVVLSSFYGEQATPLIIVD